MSETAPVAACPNCGRVRPAEELGPRGWCTACRREVVRRARKVAIAVGVLAAAATIAVIAALYAAIPRFLIGWVVLVAAVYFVTFRLAQRVAFEVIRGRGVPPPTDDDA